MKQQHYVATALPKPEDGKGVVLQLRAQGHHVKTGIIRKAQVLSEMLPDAQREVKKYPARLLSSFCPPISCKYHPLTETSQGGDDMGAWKCSLQGHFL